MTDNPTAPEDAPQENTFRAYATDAVAELTGDVYSCTRVWEAWSYGTMTAEDFTPVAEDPDVLADIVNDVIRTLVIDEAVDRLALHLSGHNLHAWSFLSERRKDTYRDEARAAINALLGEDLL